jgi:hypothetical protein
MNSHRVHGNHPVLRDLAPDPERLQECDVCRAQGVDARIEIPGSNGGRGLLRDQRDRQSARRAREARADRTAADDDEVVPPRVYNRVSIRGELAQLVRAAES